MSSKIYETLEFNQIINQLNAHTRTELGADLVVDIKPTNRLNILNYLQAETQQALQLIELSKGMPIPDLATLEIALKRLKIKATLNGQELSQINQLLGSVREIRAFFVNLAEEEDKFFPQLTYWSDQMIALPAMEKMISKAIDRDGSILSTASGRLSSIRRRLVQTEHQVRQVLNSLLQKRSNELSDSLITIRNDRYVLPVKAEFRNNFGGTIHDQSSTGQTIYIEPQAVLKLNNKRAQLQVDERQEEERILQEISQQLAAHHQEIQLNESRMGQLDFIHARAAYAQEIQGTKPKFSKDQAIKLYQARHPLIDAKKIVANDIFIGTDYQTLVITGPNTGGKTIMLKTLGLLQLMGQSGLHIPADNESQLGVFDQVYADIGDEQSIEQSLSTFSSHLTNIVDILKRASRHSLILLDELGSGTDPQEGASLAIAILNHIRKIGSIAVATTHYPELKVYADHTDETMNASMEFDTDSLSPTYRLLIGVPGRSNALEISRRIGLDASILQEAEAGISHDSSTINEMVENLEQQRQQSQAQYLATQEELKKAEELHQELKQEYEEFHHQREAMLEKARQEANQQVEKARQEAERIVSEIRELQLEQGQKITIKEQTLQDKQSGLDDLQQKKTKSVKNRVLRRAEQAKELALGDEVEVLTYNQRGSVIEKRGKDEYMIQMGILKMPIARKDLRPLKNQKQNVQMNIQRGVNRQISTQLDLRGKRYEDAMQQLESYLDSALLANHPQVTIIHGHGTGAIREGVQQTLQKHPQVKKYAYSYPNSGGQGSTVVHFK